MQVISAFQSLLRSGQIELTSDLHVHYTEPASLVHKLTSLLYTVHVQQNTNGMQFTLTVLCSCAVVLVVVAKPRSLRSLLYDKDE